jgi:hypothetical protein
MVAVQGPNYYVPPLHLHSFIHSFIHYTVLIISAFTFVHVEERRKKRSDVCVYVTAVTDISHEDLHAVRTLERNMFRAGVVEKNESHVLSVGPCFRKSRGLGAN